MYDNVIIYCLCVFLCLISLTDNPKSKRKGSKRRGGISGEILPVEDHGHCLKNKGLSSRYPDTDRVLKVIDESGVNNYVYLDIDPNVSFLERLQMLFLKSEHPRVIHYEGTENSNFSDGVRSSKNVYLSTLSVLGNENVLYSFDVRYNSTNIISSLYIGKSENIFNCSIVSDSYSVFYSKSIYNSNHIRYSSNMSGCSECIQCTNLNNKNYCIQNIQYSKEEYERKKNNILISLMSIGEQIYGSMENDGLDWGNQNCLGRFIINSENITDGCYINSLKNGHNVCFSGSPYGAESHYDAFISGGIGDFYGVMEVGGNTEQIYCSVNISTNCNSIFYSFFLESCSFCLGCIGLKNKSYCIFNKQYTKEERYTRVDEIFGQMEKNGTLGEFFPATMNPFYFNDTAAYLIDPSFTKEEVTAKGYLRRDEPIKVDIPANAEIVKWDELDRFEGRNHDERYINPDILKKVIQDEHGNFYRIIPMEYKFLMKHGLPLPRKHWLERMKENFRID